jgi:hypothetical protein
MLSPMLYLGIYPVVLKPYIFLGSMHNTTTHHLWNQIDYVHTAPCRIPPVVRRCLLSDWCWSILPNWQRMYVHLVKVFLVCYSTLDR